MINWACGLFHRRRQVKCGGLRKRNVVRVQRTGESLEARELLAADLRITELVASNRNGILDGNGEASDWIEIYNAGDTAAELGGYYLTDDPENLRRWQFPAITLGSAEFLVVFASGNGQPDPAGHLHTNFGLSRSGEFVALVEPNGQTIVWQLEFSGQRTDVSYGVGQTVQEVVLLDRSASGRVYVPTAADAAIASQWQRVDPPFDDSTWTPATTGIGYGGEVQGNGTENIALGANVTASGPLWTGFPPTRLTDGDRTTISHPAEPVAEFSYVVDLGEEQSLGRINIYNRADGCCAERLSNYRVSLHDDDEGSLGPPVWSADIRTDGTNSGPRGVDAIRAALDPNGDFAGRYIRIAKIDDGSRDYWPQIAEVEVFPSLGYGPLIDTNVETLLKDKSSTMWLRLPFEVDDASAYEQLEMSIQYDDGFIAYVNGQEVARRNAPELIDGVTDAATTTNRGSSTETIFLPRSALRTGQNVLAIQGLNVAADDNDFVLLPQLTGRRVTDHDVGFMAMPTPGAFNASSVAGFLDEPTFSVPRGFYAEPLQVTVSASRPGATLIFTTDGSAPSREHGQAIVPADAESLAEVTVDVNSTQAVRAVTVLDGWASSAVETHSYLFLDQIIRQPERPEGMPSSWAGSSPDYEMDPVVVDDPAYTERLLEGLRSIPTLSVVTDHDHLWDSRDGIYIHSTQRGAAWERPVSLELIQPDGTTGFQADAGLRMWGTGWAPHSSSRKHSFQLKFKSEYGPTKLEYPLFPDAPVDEFDDIVLRAQGSRSWYDFRQPDIGQSQYLRDAWARDTARDMGKLEGHATFVHLYLNGLYWGLYNPVERTNEKFAEEYLGGVAEDYDVINKRSGQATHATSGNMDAWNAMMAIANAGVESDEAYAAIQQYLDIDDFIDYMLINQYATNHDGPDQGGNNMRALRRRDESGRFTFHVWDMEYTFWYPGEHRNIDGDVPDAAMRLFSRLRQNHEFQLRFADRVQKHLFGDGALTPERAAARYLERANEIDTAIIGESARWGDGRRAGRPYTRDVEWVAERDRLLNEYFPVRTAILLDQLQRGGLYPYVTAPAFSHPSGDIAVGKSVELDAQAGTVYYTLDGTDPRQRGGAPSDVAVAFQPRTPLITEQSAIEWLVPQDDRFDASWMLPDPSGDPAAWQTASLPFGSEGRASGEASSVALQNATATFSEARRPVTQTIDGDLGGRGWGFSQPVDFQGPVIRAPIAVWETVEDVSFDDGAELTFTLFHDSRRRASLGRFRISITSDDRDTFADGLESSGDVTAQWHPVTWISLESSEGAEFTVLPDNSILVSGGENSSDTYTLRAVTPRRGITGIRLEAIADATLPGRAGPGRAPGGLAYLSEISLAARPANLAHEFDGAEAAALAQSLQSAAAAGAGSSTYVRIPFQIDEQPDLDGLQLVLSYPDAFVAYLNGVEIERQGVQPGTRYDSSAASDRADAMMLETETFDVSHAIGLLRQGDNVLALHVLTEEPSDTLRLSAELTGTRSWGQRFTEVGTVHARTFDAGQWSALESRTYRPTGDLSGDGRVDAIDLNLVCAAIEAGQNTADLNRDGRTDRDDYRHLIDQVLATTEGDANLDGRFDSRDLVLVFQRGLYEQEGPERALWESGDWNCDGRFSTDDLVEAFAKGSYAG